MAVIILSIVILLLGVLAFMGIFNSIHWKREYEGCRERRHEDSKEHDNALAEANSKARATIEALNDQYEELRVHASEERENRDEMVELFFELHPDLKANFGAWSDGLGRLECDYRGVDWSKIRNYREQQEASERFSEYVKAKRDAMGHEPKGSQ